jgi:hypothetical protein
MKATTRWQAFGIHILISLLVFVLLASTIYYWWYPGILFLYDGGIDGLKLIAGVDFFIGPVLTLMVYKQGKKGMAFDLFCIAIAQAICLAGGMWTIWQTRPVAVVYAAGTFAVANQRGYEHEGQAIDAVDALRGHWPVSLAVNLPEDEEDNISGIWAQAGSGIQYNVENYVPYQQMVPRLASKGRRAADIKTVSGDLQSLENLHPEIRFFPMTTSEYVGYVAVDTKTGAILKFFPKD